MKQFFDKPGFMSYMENTFAMENFGRNLVDHLVDLGIQNEITSDDSLADFLCEFIPELSYREAAAFCHDDILSSHGKKVKEQFWQEQKEGRANKPKNEDIEPER